MVNNSGPQVCSFCHLGTCWNASYTGSQTQASDPAVWRRLPGGPDSFWNFRIIQETTESQDGESLNCSGKHAKLGFRVLPTESGLTSQVCWCHPADWWPGDIPVFFCKIASTVHRPPSSALLSIVSTEGKHILSGIRLKLQTISVKSLCSCLFPAGWLSLENRSQETSAAGAVLPDVAKPEPAHCFSYLLWIQ